MAVLADRVSEVRAFTRFFTAVMGVLDEGLLQSPYTLTEARVVFELAQADRSEVLDVRTRLGLDPGYLSRILARFEADGLVVRERSGADARRQVVRLTPTGRDVYAMLDARSSDQVRVLLDGLAEDEQRRVVEAMGTIRSVLGGPQPARSFVLRELRAGDLGWVVHRHGVLYAEEYGWDETFEALVARIVADYVDGRDADRENAWIADVDGRPGGCVFCVRADDETAKLRLLLVEPSARGLGVGSALVDECVRFARAAGYARVALWTNDVLTVARRIYERAGFELVEEDKHHSFGRDLVGQYWRLEL